ncbi:MAG: AAA family ATPase [Dehalococcoidales bacterium]|nr:AAA family ATPase [Dehalococcoidales bacterium]
MDINPLFKEFKPAIYHHKSFSFNAVPFLWMIKSKSKLSSDEKRNDPSDYPHKSIKAETYELEYDPALEEQVDQQLGFEGNTWVQHPNNQKALLDAFFGCLRRDQSLIFFYCKHTPLSEPNERVIVGVAKVRKDIGPILEYNFAKGYTGHKCYPWDRCVEHTLTDKNPDGFLMPYHEILSHVKENGLEIDLRDYAAMAPDLLQFSYASELVEHDTAIDALLNMAEGLRKSSLLLGKTFKQELDWIDNEISKIWDMRGAFPGMGPVLSALGINEGNTIAWEIEKYIQQKDGNLFSTDPWDILERSFAQPEKYVGSKGRKLFSKTGEVKWNSKSPSKKEFYKLLSRCQLNNAQASFVIDHYKDVIGSIDEMFHNLYLLYERSRFEADGISFLQVDKAMLPPERFKEAFPLPDSAALSHNLDSRRLRAATVWVMEEAAEQGHSVLSFDDVLERLKEKSLDESLPIDEDILASQIETEVFTEEILSIPPSEPTATHFVKLQRLVELKRIITQRINLKRIAEKTYGINKDWIALINQHPKFTELNPKNTDYKEELQARLEKAEALKVLTNYSFSVLIGPAGSGKTSLLEIFWQQPEIQSGGVLKLAPTGKARVKLGHDAKTIAEFLYPDRYDGSTGTYYPNESAARFASARNVIIDEASMLTEEQLAALFDALGPVDRIIMAGDYRQLPPIGTGRPFVDITKYVRPQAFANKSFTIDKKTVDFVCCSGPAYAELTKIRRQPEKGDVRWDVLLSRCFSDNPSKEDLEAFHALASGSISSKHIRLQKWYENTDFRQTFEILLEEELGLDKTDLTRSFNRNIGAKDVGNYQYFNCGYSEKEIEKWQIISPVNGFGYGIKEINKLVQTTYRKPYIDLALNAKPEGATYHPKRKVAKPKCSDNVVYGDKVINLRNTHWEDWQWIKPMDRKATALKYIANGEIGVITGEFKSKDDKAKREPAVEITFSTQPGYSYVFWPEQLSEEGKYSLDLAYAITVHKAQGSGFGIVFFVLPSKGAILSRELIYTALTRQENKIIILHQGDFRDYIRLASTEASATARRFTDLFELPEVKQISNKWYDAHYVNISERGEPMISKSEVIIANCLNKYKESISYAYEDKLKLVKGGRTVKPDFTIESLVTRKLFYWEHLGMMTKTDYREKWQKKLQGYQQEGFVLYTEAKPADERILITTEDNPSGGINSQEIDRIVRTTILGE